MVYLNRDTDTRIVPETVAVHGAHVQDVVAAFEVRIGDASLSTGIDPVSVEAIEPIRVAVLLRRGVIESSDTESDDVVAEAELQSVDPLQRYASRVAFVRN